MKRFPNLKKKPKAPLRRPIEDKLDAEKVTKTEEVTEEVPDDKVDA